MEKEKIFIYGTLKSMLVQLTLFGRNLDMMEGVLHNYEVYSGGDGCYLVFPQRGAKVIGHVAELTGQEMKIADSWEETPDYERRQLLVVCDGIETMAWVYVRKDDTKEQSNLLPDLCYNL